jgi:hypothetical protein
VEDRKRHHLLAYGCGLPSETAFIDGKALAHVRFYNFATQGHIFRVIWSSLNDNVSTKSYKFFNFEAWAASNSSMKLSGTTGVRWKCWQKVKLATRT